MNLNQVKTITIPADLLREYKAAQDQYILVQDWLTDRFDDMPSLTRNPDFVDAAVEIIENRIDAITA